MHAMSASLPLLLHRFNPAIHAHRAPDPAPAEEPLPEPFDTPHQPVHLPHDEEPVPDPKPSMLS